MVNAVISGIMPYCEFNIVFSRYITSFSSVQRILVSFFLDYLALESVFIEKGVRQFSHGNHCGSFR